MTSAWGEGESGMCQLRDVLLTDHGRNYLLLPYFDIAHVSILNAAAARIALHDRTREHEEVRSVYPEIEWQLDPRRTPPPGSPASV